jgi:hypothetical protein
VITTTDSAFSANHRLNTETGKYFRGMTAVPKSACLTRIDEQIRHLSEMRALMADNDHERSDLTRYRDLAFVPRGTRPRGAYSPNAMNRCLSWLLAVVILYGCLYALCRYFGLLYLDEYGFYRGYRQRTANIIAPAQSGFDPLTTMDAVAVLAWYGFLPLHAAETSIRNGRLVPLFD